MFVSKVSRQEVPRTELKIDISGDELHSGESLSAGQACRSGESGTMSEVLLLESPAHIEADADADADTDGLVACG